VTRLRALGALVALALLVTACGSDPGPSAAGARAATETTVERTQLLVTVGGSATFGDGLDESLRDGWPHVLHRTAFPRATVLVNAAVRRSTAREALEQQVPLVEELRPAVVAIWLGSVEVRSGSPVDEFAADLGAVVRRADATGARVLLANLPRGPDLDVDAYNAAIARIASAQDVALVRLDTLAIGNTGQSPFLPDREGHRAIAAAFADALRR
jgi:hypothetical protein